MSGGDGRGEERRGGDGVEKHIGQPGRRRTFNLAGGLLLSVVLPIASIWW